MTEPRRPFKAAGPSGPAGRRRIAGATPTRRRRRRTWRSSCRVWGWRRPPWWLTKATTPRFRFPRPACCCLPTACFFHPARGGLTLLYGQPDLAAPRYDLALLAPRLMGVSGQELAPAPEEAAPAPPDRAPTQKKVFWAVLLAAVVILLLLLVRLLRSSEPAPG